MEHTYKYSPDALVTVVHVALNARRVLAGEMTWEDAASGPGTAWAIAADKAEQTQVLIAVHEDTIEGAWSVTGVTNHSAIPEGKTRTVNRAQFETVADPRLDYLLKTPSPLALPRNPQGVLELRDLPGADVLLFGTPPPAHGVAQLGPYTLTVSKDGDAELRIPVDARLAIRTTT
ncbi:hypothetical protein ACIBEH_32785 [Nocardia salmonicida]|uniref:hypothetical protein n=1 Tax=Nocardia salmonicida TaxID=53431 RepID=UPI0037BD28FF